MPARGLGDRFFRQQTGVIKANPAVDNMFRYGPRV